MRLRSQFTSILNLSKSLTFRQPTIKFKTFTFPGGEEHIKIEPNKSLHEANDIIIATSMNNSAVLIQTLLGTEALRFINPRARLSLFSPYFPYARQDRRMVQGEPLSIKVVANIINSQQYHRVDVLDPHSDVTSSLLNNINIIDSGNFVKQAWRHIQLINPDHVDICLVSPDAGAEKKIYKIAQNLGLDNTLIIRGSKRRDVKTGKLSNSEFVGDVKGKICCIFDDMIDGGATFIQLAKALKNGGSQKVYLIVSHGIFSKGLDELKLHLDGVYTTDSFRLMNDEFVKQIPINTFYPI